MRGCIYDSSSIKQFDNLSFVKSYEFVSTSKKYTYENHDTSANKLIFPFDLTDYCRFDKKLTVTVNLNKKLVDGKKIAVGVYFVKKLDFAKTIEQVHNLEKIRRKKSDITKNQGNLSGSNYFDLLDILLVTFLIPPASTSSRSSDECFQ